MVKIIDIPQTYFYKGKLEEGIQLFKEPTEDCEEITLSPFSVVEVRGRHFLLKADEPNKFIYHKFEEGKLEYFYKSKNGLIVKDEEGNLLREEIIIYKGMNVVVPNGEEGTVLEYADEVAAVKTPKGEKAYYIKDLKTMSKSADTMQQYLEAMNNYQRLSSVIQETIVQENTAMFKGMFGEHEEEKIAKEALKPQPIDTPKVNVETPKIQEPKKEGLLSKVKNVFTPKTPLIHPDNFLSKQPTLEHNFKNKLHLTLNEPNAKTFDVKTATPEHYQKLGIDEKEANDYAEFAKYNPPELSSSVLLNKMHNLHGNAEAVNSKFKEAGFDYIKHHNGIHNPESGNTHDLYAATHSEAQTNPIGKKETTAIEKPTFVNNPEHLGTEPIHLSTEQLQKNTELKEKGGSVVHKLVHVDLNPNSMGDNDKYLYYYKKPNGQTVESDKLLDPHGTEVSPKVQSDYIKNVIGDKLFIPGETVSHNGNEYKVVSHIGKTGETRDLNTMYAEDEQGNKVALPKNEVQKVTDFSNSSKVTLTNGQQKHLHQLKSGDSIQVEDGSTHKVLGYQSGRGLLTQGYDDKGAKLYYHPESKINEEYLTSESPHLKSGQLIRFSHGDTNITAKVHSIDKPNKRVIININPKATEQNASDLRSIPIDFATDKKKVKHLPYSPMKDLAGKKPQPIKTEVHEKTTGVKTSDKISEEATNQINNIIQPLKSESKKEPTIHKFEDFKSKDEATQKLSEVNDKIKSLVEENKSYADSPEYKKLSQQKTELNDIAKQHDEKQKEKQQTKEKAFGQHAQNYKEFVDNLSSITNEPHERSDTHSVHKTGIGDLELRTEHDTAGGIKVTPSSKNELNGKPVVSYKNNKGQQSNYYVDKIEKDPIGSQVNVTYHDSKGKEQQKELSAFKQHIAEQEFEGSQQTSTEKPKKKNVLQKIEEKKAENSQVAENIKNIIQSKSSEPEPVKKTETKIEPATKSIVEPTKEVKENALNIDSLPNATGGHQVKMVPRSEINKDYKRFQGRPEKEAKESAKKVVDNVLENGGKMDEAPFDAPVLWNDPKDKKTYVLAGHSRDYGHEILTSLSQLKDDTASGKVEKNLKGMGYTEEEVSKIKGRVRTGDLSKVDFNVYQNMPAKFANYDNEDQAIKFAKEQSNYGHKPEPLYKTAEILRGMRDKGIDEKEIEKKANSLVHKNGTYVYELSHLDPNGNTIKTLSSIDESTDKKTRNKIEEVASYIGNAKRNHRENLSRAHEEDMLNHLLEPKNFNKYKSKTDFTNAVGELVEHPNYNKGTKLQFETGGYNTDKEKEWKKQFDSLNKESKRLEQQLKDKKEEYAKRATTESDWKEEHTNKANQELDKVRTGISDIEKQKAKLKSEFGKYSQADKEQLDMFGSANESEQDNKRLENYNNEKNKYENFADKTTEHKDYSGINPENITHFNQGSNHERVSMIMPAVDKTMTGGGSAWNKMIVGKNLSSADRERLTAKYNQAVDTTIRHFGVDSQKAKSMIKEVSQKYKDLAKQHRHESKEVLLNTFKHDNIHTHHTGLNKSFQSSLFSDDELSKSVSSITMPTKEFVEEHNKLSNILISGTPSDRLEEAREQFKELKKQSKTVHIASVAVINGDKILMGRRTDGEKLFTLPGGHIEGDEVPVEGAIRELQEETGIETSANKLKYLGSENVKSIDNKELTIHSFLLKTEEPTTTKEDPDGEVSRWNWIKTPISEDILNNLHAKKNVTLKFLGLQKWENNK